MQLGLGTPELGTGDTETNIAVSPSSKISCLWLICNWHQHFTLGKAINLGFSYSLHKTVIAVVRNMHYLLAK